MRFFIFYFILIICMGCATSQPLPGSSINREETEAALESIAEAISGQELSEEDVKKLKEQIRKDPEAQSAIKVITNSVSGQNQRWKYSPATGKRYEPHMEVDPETCVPLKCV